MFSEHFANQLTGKRFSQWVDLDVEVNIRELIHSLRTWLHIPGSFIDQPPIEIWYKSIQSQRRLRKSYPCFQRGIDLFETSESRVQRSIQVGHRCYLESARIDKGESVIEMRIA